MGVVSRCWQLCSESLSAILILLYQQPTIQDKPKLQVNLGDDNS